MGSLQTIYDVFMFTRLGGCGEVGVGGEGWHVARTGNCVYGVGWVASWLLDASSRLLKLSLSEGFRFSPPGCRAIVATSLVVRGNTVYII